MTSPPACLACGRSTRADDLWFDHLWRCRGCGLVFADLEAFPETDSAYAEAYFKGAEYCDYVAERPVVRKNLKRHLDRISGYAPPGRLFEIGCAYGFFLDLARGRWEAAGIDISPPAVRYARDVLGVEAYLGDFLRHPLAHDSVDVFCLWDTLEHLRRPDLYLEKMSRCLRPGGAVCLTTGDIGSLNARLRGRSWRLIHPPTHLYYFSRSSLHALFLRYGLRVVHLGYTGYDRAVRAMLHQSALHVPGGLFKTGLLRIRDRFPPALTLHLNLLDIILAVARKART